MSNQQVLNNLDHQDLRVNSQLIAGLGDDISYTNVFVSEFRQVQGCYPIFFRKHTQTGQFEAISMFGFGPQENLYLTKDGWQTDYVPLSIKRRPFLIGFKNVQQDGVLQQEPVVYVDMDSPRIGDENGQRVFLEQGGQSEYLQQINSTLQAIHQGHEQTKAFIDALLEQELIEQVSIKVTLKDNSQNELNSLYTVNEEKVAALSGDVLQQLHHSGYLQMIHMMEASLSNLSTLIEMKNRTL